MDGWMDGQWVGGWMSRWVHKTEQATQNHSPPGRPSGGPSASLPLASDLLLPGRCPPRTAETPQPSHQTHPAWAARCNERPQHVVRLTPLPQTLSSPGLCSLWDLL